MRTLLAEIFSLGPIAVGPFLFFNSYTLIQQFSILFSNISILSISLVFTIIAGVIFGVKQLQTVYTYYLALDMFQTATVLFLEGITIGVLLNLIAKRKKEK